MYRQQHGCVHVRAAKAASCGYAGDDVAAASAKTWRSEEIEIKRRQWRAASINGGNIIWRQRKRI